MSPLTKLALVRSFTFFSFPLDKLSYMVKLGVEPSYFLHK